MEFYSYLWLRENGSPYYVGKGTGNRAFVRHRKGFSLSPPKDKSRILILPRKTEDAAFATEIELIHNWGRKDLGTGCLRNMTAGGDGASGRKHTEEFRRNLSERNRGNRYGAYVKSEETREKLRRALTGRVFTPETLEKMAAGHKGQIWSAESRAKASASHKGKSNGLLGFKHSENSKARMSASRMGHPSYVTPEGIAKMKATKALKKRSA